MIFVYMILGSFLAMVAMDFYIKYEESAKRKFKWTKGFK